MATEAQERKEKVIRELDERYANLEIEIGDLEHLVYDAGYAEGLEAAAKVAEAMAYEYSSASHEIGDYQHAKTVAANSVAAAIRNLKNGGGKWLSIRVTQR